tara:strand:- start:11 stop:226 length:216 start_codon:yes stop_codon:yes gene_type:complete
VFVTAVRGPEGAVKLDDPYKAVPLITRRFEINPLMGKLELPQIPMQGAWAEGVAIVAELVPIAVTAPFTEQ